MDSLTVQEAIRTKRAVREFSDQPISDELLTLILNAGRRAQSSKNTQPWTFIAIRDRETLKRLSETGGYAGHLAGANVVIALVSNEEGTEFDLGQAAAYMQLAAWEHGIGSCIASIWEPDKGRAILGIPEGHSFDIAISFGYPAQNPAAPRKQGRRPLDEIVRHDKW